MLFGRLTVGLIRRAVPTVGGYGWILIHRKSKTIYDSPFTIYPALAVYLGWQDCEQFRRDL